MKSTYSGPYGVLRFWRFDPPTKQWTPGRPTRNQTMYGWGFAAAQSLGYGKTNYRINGMYLEFENVADPEDAVTPPDFTPDAGIEYYQALSGSGTRDYMRVPLVSSPVLSIHPGYEDGYEAGVTGNKLTVYAQSAGSTGVHGKTFSNGVNSKLFGAALIVAPDWGDATQDIICNRAYVASDEQLVKPTMLQLSASWELSFLLPGS